VAASSPLYARREDVPGEVIEREKAIYRAQLEGSKKPDTVIEKIVEGKLESFYEEAVLVDQPSIRDPKVKVGQMIQATIAKVGENITVSRFARLKVGESA
jgi:elongation factor Ts